jgi:hypothetical protein
LRLSKLMSFCIGKFDDLRYHYQEHVRNYIWEGRSRGRYLGLQRARRKYSDV